MHKSKNRESRTWVVTHCEFMRLGPKGAYIVDEMPFYTASSLTKALGLIRRGTVDPGTWWKVYELTDEGPERWWTYSRSGRRIKSPPFKAGLRSAKRRDRKHLKLLKERLATLRREGGSKKEIRAVAASVKAMRR